MPPRGFHDIIHQQYMQEMVEARKTSEKKVEQFDLFTGLLDANEDETDGQAKLTDRELLGMLERSVLERRCSQSSAGNIFIFLLAGKLSACTPEAVNGG